MVQLMFQAPVGTLPVDSRSLNFSEQRVSKLIIVIDNAIMSEYLMEMSFRFVIIFTTLFSFCYVT